MLQNFQRTASTHLHEMGYPSDAIEKALAHKIVGIKGLYNRAEYAEQRHLIMQAWADFVQAQIEGEKSHHYSDRLRFPYLSADFKREWHADRAKSF